MTETTNLALPFIAAAQAQKHVTHNEALRILDALVQLAVVDRDLDAPPGTPAEGDRYIVGSEPSGAWDGHALHVAAFQDGTWMFGAPRPGWIAFVLDEAMAYVWTGGEWVAMQSLFTALQNLALLGVGTAADTENPFAAKLNKALWSARTEAEGGDGDLRYALNKESAAHVLSLLLQSGWSGRAEIGLVGDDDLAIKVSADGAIWNTALRADRASGRLAFPNTPMPHVLAHSAVAVAHTGNTAETVLATVTVQAGAMGADGALRIASFWSMNNSANNKTRRVRFGGIGGTAFMQFTTTTNASGANEHLIMNRAAADSQLGAPAAGSSWGNSGTAVVTAAIDTAQAQDIVFTGQLADAADSIALQGYLVELIR